MSTFDEYSQQYDHILMERRDGTLQMTLHTDGGPLRWGLRPQAQLVEALGAVGADRGNRLVILTGTGEEFIGPRSDPHRTVYAEGGVELTPAGLDRVHWNARRLVTRLLDIEIPMIAVVNGPAKRHAELALMCDIVLAAEDATFEDTAHFQLGGHVPGDGINVVYTMLLGLNRARYLMLTGQVLSAAEAKDLGLVAEVMPRRALLPRAWELARQLAAKPDLLLRYTRLVLIHPLRKAIDEGLGYFLSLETLATLDSHR
ncbi:MAG: enoyl-CoA hydratase/isomerase family protein [Candidatus Rokubacteria bacterium]|nr:enoyl-CoA hydratase/isomerase family protein [Candidatus Rokubacteria bacterium]